MSQSQQSDDTRKRIRDDDEEETEINAVVSGFVVVLVGALYEKDRVNEISWNMEERTRERAEWMDSLMNDRICKDQLRMDRRYFDKLCHILQHEGGLVTTRFVTVREVVAFFLHTLAHDLKNRTIGAVFTRSGETVSRQFHMVLQAIMKICKYYIKQTDSSVSYVGDSRWKWFEGALGALDGTHIKMTVPIEDRPRYRDRKGDISTDVLATCDPRLRFSYVLPGWEGSASDPRVLGDALRRPNGLRVSRNKYFLVDLGYANGPGFLAPYRGTRYHLNLWRGNTPTNYKELFNLRHSSARNTIERAFGLLKKRWAILRKSSFYDKKTQVRIMNACFILHNFLREEDMEESNLLDEVDEELSAVNDPNIGDEVDDIVLTARVSSQWNDFRDELARKMFDEYQARRL